MMPGVGRFNWPVSMLTWDVMVLGGYLLINLHVVGYLLYTRYLGRHPDPRWYKPFVFLRSCGRCRSTRSRRFCTAGSAGGRSGTPPSSPRGSSPRRS
jgi:hypothetical protein